MLLLALLPSWHTVEGVLGPQHSVYVSDVPEMVQVEYFVGNEEFSEVRYTVANEFPDVSYKRRHQR